MSNTGMFFILNQGWRLGVVVVCIILIRAVLKRMTLRCASYSLWYSIPICYLYIMGVECFHVIYNEIHMNASNEPYLFLSETASMVIKAVWLTVCIGMLIYMVYSYVKTKCIAKTSRHFSENIYITERSDMPFTIGGIKPRIYLPANMKEEFYEPVICHERVHIFRKDYLIKNAAFVLLAINWFQPLMWLAYYLFVRDMEVTCDEVVLRGKSAGFRKQYAKALLELSTREICVGFLATGYGSVALKERLINISRKRRGHSLRRFLVTVICIVMVLLSVSGYEYIRKPFGSVPNVAGSTNEVWEVRTRIKP